MGSKKDQIGRTVIDYLKAEYQRGICFPNAEAIQTALLHRFGFKPCKVTKDRVSSWDRQARYEINDDGGTVTPPVPSHAYERDPNAHAKKRAHARSKALQPVATALSNQWRGLRAEAAQVDATRQEIETEMAVRIALEVLAKMPVKK